MADLSVSTCRFLVGILDDLYREVLDQPLAVVQLNVSRL